MSGWLALKAGMAGASLVSGMIGSSKAEKAAKKAAKLEKKMTGEQLDRLEDTQAKDWSKTRALIAAGGFDQDSVTQVAYKDEFQRLQTQETEWLKLVGASKYNQQRDRADAYQMEGYASAFSGAAKLGSSMDAWLNP
jgi:hypothetical protein